MTLQLHMSPRSYELDNGCEDDAVTWALATSRHPTS